MSSFTHLVEGNRKPLWLSLVARNDNPDNEYSELSRKNLFGIPAITNEVYYIPETKDETPLYYRHQLVNYYYTHQIYSNEQIVSSSSIASGIPIPTVSGTTLVRDTIVVYFGDDDTPFLDFYLDCGRGMLHFWPQAELPDPLPDRITVRYLSVPIVVQLVSERLSVHRFEARSTNIPFLFAVDILSTTAKPITATFISYNSYLGNAVSVTEETTAVTVFEFVPSNYFTGQKPTYSAPYQNDYTYTVDSNGVIFVMAPPSTFYMRSRDLSSDTRLYPISPRNVAPEYDWFPAISDAEVVTANGTYGYPPHEERGQFEYHRETVRGAHVPVVQVSTALPCVYRKHDGTIGGVEVIVNENEQAVVRAYDIDANTLHLSRVYTQQHILVISYYSRALLKAVDITLNPLLPSHTGKALSRDNAVVILLPPRESGVFRPIGAVLPMYNANGGMITFSYSELDSIFNAEIPELREENREKYILFLPTELREHPEYNLLPIGIFYTINPFGPQSFIIEDARISGGGWRTYMPNAFDYSHYDTEGTDLSAFVTVTVKRSLIDAYAEQLAKSDRETLLQQEPEEYAKTKAREHLSQAIKRHLLPGTVVTIEEIDE